MNKRKLTPQENKIRDYLHQRTNCYGENDKSSRKAIKVNKATVRRSFRRNTQNFIRDNDEDWEIIECKVANVVRANWRKAPDECLLKSFEHKWSDNSRINHLADEKKGLQLEALKRLNKMKTRVYFY